MPPRSGHQRAKNIAYEEDDVYSDNEYYEEDGDGMTDEDREQLRQGTIMVKEALGSSVSVSDSQIQEALWHYYFDVGKSVTYLKNKHGPAKTIPASKPKAPSRFDQAASSAALLQTKGQGEPPISPNREPDIACIAPSPRCISNSNVRSADKSATMTTASKGCVETPDSVFPFPAPLDHLSILPRDFFWDTPWGNVESCRLGVIREIPVLPRGRLLGGSSRPSKLAALAAARKKKQEEANRETAVPQPNASASEADQAVALLDKLNFKNKAGNGSSTPTPSEERGRNERLGRLQFLKRQSSPEKVNTPPEEPPEPEEEVLTVQVPNIRTTPSMFASTICGIGRLPAAEQPSVISSFPVPFSGMEDPTSRGLFAGPSPDDIVLRAQAKGNKPKGGQQKTPKEQKLAQSMETLAVEETPSVKSKNLNVAEEFEKSGMKRMANFVVVGHVDHGKSTLMGRLLYDLKVVDQRSIDKLRKEAETIGKSSFALAWVMDQTSEERNRGVTVDIATNYFETEKTRFTILDAPGHKDFIPNMIAGASQADFAVLVIDASTNSFESGLRGQTKEHALLVRSLGVQRLVVAVNKMDTVSWSQERFEEIKQQMSAFLTTANFAKKSITFVPCAGLTGDNVTHKVEDSNARWYTGETLVEALDASEPGKRHIEKPFRLTISDVFRGGITNPISISGRIDSGSVQVGDPILALPANEKAVVKVIEVENAPVDWAVAGQIATLHLADIDPVHLRTGDIMCDPKDPVKLTKSFTCKILAFEHVLPATMDVFRGRLQAEGKISKLVALLDKTSGEIVKNKPRVVKPGEVARVVVDLEKELPLEIGIRVVFREGGNTVAAGLLEG
ncbi:uncharacterized protein EI97DRAFT_502040 [Westerdykella ornata]|uniref:Elongation factor 1 alpha-like protein n=1 Tax=Westerdykella ornata TaxID=318751 RepID=A0A6A6JH98_WESOR|nr:uncharacterized protein EI97DRAFT_502040 [Westerdykella ornata]KAF2275483.1 hypothetical protein EI97DRAFT_502040 [Westerdykella ornata]